MSNSSGRANLFGQGVTGAPGDTSRTCASSGCHSSGAFSPNASLMVTDNDGNAVSSFVPGQTYDVSLVVEATGTPSAYGFQMIALDNDDSPVNNWGELGSNVQKVSVGPKDYIEHSSPSSSNEFRTKWTAPSEGTGDVTFYFAANAVNGNGGTSGDGGTNSNFVLPEITTSTNNLDEESISVYPSPASDFVTISGDNIDYNYTIFDIRGQKIGTSNFTGEIGLDISHLEKGLYFIHIQNEAKFITKKLYKN